MGQTVALCGWVHSYRDHGGLLFIDLRDREGLVQAVADPKNETVFALVQTLRSEFVVKISGVVRLRPSGTENKNLPTGEVEVDAQAIEILNTAAALPFEISEFNESSEEVRLQYRYLDLRRPSLRKNLILRHKITQAARALLDKEGFLEIETPFLTKSTPEGARDFLVASRLQPGSFYALPQSPQLFKQILMVGGLDRYYQVARCFRDEDLRSDRQPEFTQIDLEMSFVTEEDVMAVTEQMVAAAMKVATGLDCPLPIPRIKYRDAMNRYGSDKPDLRYGLEIVDLSEELKDCGFQVFAGALKEGGVVKAIRVPEGAKFTRSEIDKLTEFVKKLGAKGLAWIKFTESGPESNLVKYFSKEELEKIASCTGSQAGDLVLFGAGPWKQVVTILGSLRCELARNLKLAPVPHLFKLVWVTDFPLLEWDVTEKRWNAMHHPFTAPSAEDVLLLETDPGKVRAHAYDIVLNGVELGGGSIRIHQKQVQEKMFEALGISPESAQEKFGFLLRALEFGAPPHGGIALGLDRLVAIFLGEESIRDTIAFPKTQKGSCPLSGSPSEVNLKQLDELHLTIKGIKK